MRVEHVSRGQARTFVQGALLRLAQTFTRHIQLKGAARLLWAARGFFSNGDGVYPVYNRLLLKIDGSQLYQWWNVINYAGFDIVLLLERLLRPGDVYLDAGANIGFMSINAARIVGPQGRVFAVEPEPRALRQLAENISINGIHNIETIQTALSDRSGTAVFRVATDQGLSRIDSGRGDDPNMVLLEKIEVAVTTLDLMIEERMGGRIPRVVKMDIEGSEFHALSGARDLLRRGETIFVFESNPGALGQHGVTFVDIHKLLREYDYDTFAIDSHSADWIRLGRRPSLTLVTDPGPCAEHYLDAVAVPRSLRGTLGNLVSRSPATTR